MSCWHGKPGSLPNNNDVGFKPLDPKSTNVLRGNAGVLLPSLATPVLLWTDEHVA